MNEIADASFRTRKAFRGSPSHHCSAEAPSNLLVRFLERCAATWNVEDALSSLSLTRTLCTDHVWSSPPQPNHRTTTGELTSFLWICKTMACYRGLSVTSPRRSRPADFLSSAGKPHFAKGEVQPDTGPDNSMVTATFFAWKPKERMHLAVAAR